MRASSKRPIPNFLGVRDVEHLSASVRVRKYANPRVSNIYGVTQTSLKLII